MPTVVRSHSKINLGLAIGPTREDGFHGLTTVYQTMEAHDLLTVSAEPAAGGESSAIVLRCRDERVPIDERNTVWKMIAAALASQEWSATPLRITVEIEKRLPVQGGMGAGSANAAAALVGLEIELERLQEAGYIPALPSLGGETRLKLAAAVGSDVPLFLIGGAVLGLGRGEQVFPLPDGRQWEATVALPDVGVSTPSAFREWDARAAALTQGALHDRLDRLSRAFASAWSDGHASGVSRRRAEDLAGNPLSTLVQTGILGNDFEQVVFRQHPFLEQIKRELEGVVPDERAVYAALSGSGSAVFGLYSDARKADRAAERLAQIGVRTLRTKTVNRNEYWSGMVIRSEA